MSRAGRIHKNTAIGAALVAALLYAASVSLADAYPRYNSGCNNCHGSFTGSTSPKGTIFPGNSKHTMHRSSSEMGTNCNLCHTDGDDRNPFLNLSNGTANTPGLGCVGCHGRDYGGTIGVSGAGLRAHHAANGVTVCAACHPSDPTPLPESVAPPYYGSVDTNVDDPCNNGPDFLENWSIGDTLGMDNDGDNVYDTADGDCAAGCPADIDGDGATGLSDLAIVLSNFGTVGGVTFADGDFDGDDDVDLADLAIILSDFGCSG